MIKSIYKRFQPYLKTIVLIAFLVLLFLSFIPLTGGDSVESEQSTDLNSNRDNSNQESGATQPPILQTAANDHDAKQTTKSKPKKLQIGIKKRAEKCDRKSKKGDLLHIHYKGTLAESGAEFDNSYKRGTPLTFNLGMGQVIQGWDQGLLGMCVGEKRKLVIPPELGYGADGAPPTIPPGATLVFEVECVKIEDSKSEL